MKIELRLSGSGGQGIILTGIILAEAAISEGKNAIQSQSYGPEARGGASKSEIIISDQEIYFTKVNKPNLFLALTQDSYDKYNKEVIAGGVCVLDERIETGTEVVGRTIYKLPIVETASEKIGKAMVTNIVALGALADLIKTVDKESIQEAMLKRIPAGTEEINLRAFEAGNKLIKELEEKRRAEAKKEIAKIETDKLFGRTGKEAPIVEKNGEASPKEPDKLEGKEETKITYIKQTGMNYE